MKQSSLKVLARSAKNRLRNGYYIEEKTDKSILPSMEKEERRIYQKMLEMATEDCVFNPLGRLVDHKVYDSLTQPQKERYVLLLSNIYIKLLKRQVANKNT